jgi:hypothetical protein
MGRKYLPRTNTLSYWIHVQVTQKLKCFEYGPRGPYLTHLTFFQNYSQSQEASRICRPGGLLIKILRFGLKTRSNYDFDTYKKYYCAALLFVLWDNLLDIFVRRQKKESEWFVRSFESKSDVQIEGSDGKFYQSQCRDFSYSDSRSYDTMSVFFLTRNLSRKVASSNKRLDFLSTCHFVNPTFCQFDVVFFK